ncbi:negative transcriptional regulator domain protein [Burkholderia pseudomallei]|nr:negative transcriptional regulator domain protein [Burkholderia pseudomallei]
MRLFGLFGGLREHPIADRVVAARLQRLARAADVARVLVLAELAFADEPRDVDLQADDRLQHRVDVVPGRVADLPWHRLRRLVRAREAGDHAAHERRFVAHGDAPVRMDDDVVPGRHLPVQFVLARIPVRRDVGVARAEHGEDFVAVRHLLPDRIRARDVRAQHAERAFARRELERDVVRVESAVAVRDQDAERVLRDQRVQRVGAVLFEMSGDVHGGSTVRPRSRGASGLNGAAIVVPNRFIL